MRQIMLSAEQMAEKIGFPTDELLECPECKKKKLFPKKHQAFNARRRKDNIPMCIECGRFDVMSKN